MGSTYAASSTKASRSPVDQTFGGDVEGADIELNGWACGHDTSVVELMLDLAGSGVPSLGPGAFEASFCTTAARLNG